MSEMVAKETKDQSQQHQRTAGTLGSRHRKNWCHGGTKSAKVYENAQTPLLVNLIWRRNDLDFRHRRGKIRQNVDMFHLIRYTSFYRRKGYAPNYLSADCPLQHQNQEKIPKKLQECPQFSINDGQRTVNTVYRDVSDNKRATCCGERDANSILNNNAFNGAF